MLYELLCAQPPFGSDHPDAGGSGILGQPPGAADFDLPRGVVGPEGSGPARRPGGDDEGASIDWGSASVADDPHG